MNTILEEILERLPVKSLFRFKSVSKQWKSIIESSYLAKRHLTRFPPKLFVLRSETSRDHSSRTILLETISKYHYDHSKIFICSYKLPDPQSEFYDDHVGRIMGYCNGLACIYHLGYIYIINLTTRKLRTLSPDFLRNCSFLPGRSKLPINVGFGRDIVTKAYKVVLMYSYDRVLEHTFVKTEVFDLNSGERKWIWFPIRVYDELSNDKTSIFANGSLYWLKKTRWIAALDLHTELFSEVLLPRCFWYDRDSSLYLWSLKDRLCVSDVQQYPDVDVWGLQQEGPSVKWEKFLSVTVSSMDCLNPNFWKLGLAACYFRPIEQKPPKKLFEEVPEDHCSTALCADDLDSYSMF